VRGDVFRHRPQLGVADWFAVGYRALVPVRAARTAPA
jgi:hypothetical protein